MKENYEENILIKQKQPCIYTCYCASTVYVLDQNRERICKLNHYPEREIVNCMMTKRKILQFYMHTYSAYILYKKKKIHIDVHHLRQTKPDRRD